MMGDRGWVSAVMSRLTRIHGIVPCPSDCDEARLLPHVLADLRARGCPGRLVDEGEVAIDGRSAGRGSVLSFVDGGRIRLGVRGGARILDYEFSMRGGLQLCAGLSVICAGLGWFALESAGLALFGLLAPLLWLYGANFVITATRVPGLLVRLCRSAPKLTEEAGP